MVELSAVWRCYFVASVVAVVALGVSAFGGPNPTEFLIEGNQMKGSSQWGASGNPWDITLMKTK